MLRISLASGFLGLSIWLAAPAHAADPLRIGEINSYKAQPAFLEPYRKAMLLALEEVNAAGGVNGRPLELLIRDDNGVPGDAVRAAEELVSRERVAMLAGGFLSNIGLALGDYARQRKVPFLASEPLTDKITWANGNRYTFRLRPSTWMQVSMLVPEAARLGKKRWAIVYPNYEYGQSAVQTFKTLLQAAQPGVEFVTEQATPLGKLDAGPVVQALEASKPDAIFNVLFATDLTKFVREGATRGLFKGREVVSLLSGEPEYLEPLKDEAPEGWIVTGYPWYAIKTPEHQRFLDAYRKKYGEPPRQGSVVGYVTIHAAAEALRRAGGTNPEKIVDAFRDMPLSSPWGPIVFRAQDNQSTLGAFVGRTALEGSGAQRTGVMVDFRYADGAKYQPTDAEVAKLRPAR
ncbi:ABC transporter substrate-binding protein [Pigmentiphaga sp.]|uniref:ABC transporter substrate-binding protein n=1 Tax=Pigmentiphaga sp. TaxID=1977564 RepID=UPI00128E60BD|nr:ABC transporter substrate-binding protein [Pigmentiphaga sp.]MPS28727.1 ABC transporter substrate-binding protein [Alcaligenaceae bacterium SAGV5]MPS52496.1 ABC transporter substrate-binding protein [Alcaligenaceae bacterium SAGV3]MPT60421.1 ABC transporter substrate-binding protein [Alcaligenaceae bacterium]